MPTGHQFRAPQGKRAPHIGAPGRGGELGLGRRCDNPREHIRTDRDTPCLADTAGQQESLVEPTLALSSTVKRHRDEEARCTAWNLGQRDLGEKIAERRGERAAPAELQGMDGFARDVFIPDGCPRIVERRWPALAHSAATRGGGTQGSTRW